MPARGPPVPGALRTPREESGSEVPCSQVPGGGRYLPGPVSSPSPTPHPRDSGLPGRGRSGEQRGLCSLAPGVGIVLARSLAFPGAPKRSGGAAARLPSRPASSTAAPQDPRSGHQVRALRSRSPGAPGGPIGGRVPPGFGVVQEERGRFLQLQGVEEAGLGEPWRGASSGSELPASAANSVAPLLHLPFPSALHRGPLLSSPFLALSSQTNLVGQTLMENFTPRWKNAGYERITGPAEHLPRYHRHPL